MDKTAVKIFLFEVSPCLLNPCQNGGVCQQFGSLGYVCACVNGFSGYNCTLFNGVPVTTGSTSSTTATPMASTTQSTTSTVTTGSTPNSTVSGSTATLMTPTTSTSTTSTTSATPTTSTSTTSKSTTSTTSATPTTQNSCSFNLCRNGASCIPTSMVTYNCSCLQGFSGTFCQLCNYDFYYLLYLYKIIKLQKKFLICQQAIKYLVKNLLSLVCYD